MFAASRAYVSTKAQFHPKEKNESKSASFFPCGCNSDTHIYDHIYLWLVGTLYESKDNSRWKENFHVYGPVTIS
jgi:hypothetical protein